jgi:hypothetical protein
MRSVSDISCRENKTGIQCAITLRGKVDKNTKVGQAKNDNMVRAHYMLDTNTHSEYVILMALLLHQWLHDGASVLCYTYCLFFKLAVKSLQIIELL